MLSEKSIQTDVLDKHILQPTMNYVLCVFITQVDAFVFIHVHICVAYILLFSLQTAHGQRMAVPPTYSNHEKTKGRTEASGYSKRPVSFSFHTHTHSAKMKQKPPWCSTLHLHCIFSGPPRKHRPYSVSLNMGPSLSLQLHLLPFLHPSVPLRLSFALPCLSYMAIVHERSRAKMRFQNILSSFHLKFSHWLRNRQK